MTALDPSTANLLPSAMPTYMPAQGWFPNKAGPSLRVERKATKEGSLADGPKTTPSLKHGSSRAREHTMPNGGFRTVSPMGGLLHREVITISQRKNINNPDRKGNSGSITRLVERSTTGRAMHPPSHDTVGGVKIGDTADETTGLKADEASPAKATAPTSPASCPLAASASNISDASKQEAKEARHSASAQIVGSQRWSPSFSPDTSKERQPTPSAPSTALAVVASLTSSP